jgi:hypothetical protein
MLAAILALVLQAVLVGFGSAPPPRIPVRIQDGQSHLHHEHHTPVSPAAPDKQSHHASGCCILGSVLGVAMGSPPTFVPVAPLALSVLVTFASICEGFGTRRLSFLPVGARTPPGSV